MDLREFRVVTSPSGKMESGGPWVGVFHETCEDSPRSWVYRGDVDADADTDLAWLVSLAQKHVCSPRREDEGPTQITRSNCHLYWNRRVFLVTGSGEKHYGKIKGWTAESLRFDCGACGLLRFTLEACARDSFRRVELA